MEARAPEQLGKALFGEETSRVSGGAAVFTRGVELGLREVRLDGLLELVAPWPRASLPAPWARMTGPRVCVEIKMPGDHVDEQAFERGLLRRQALHVSLLEREPPVTEAPAQWFVAPHLPPWLRRRHAPVRVAPGCYQVAMGVAYEVLWVAANDLPLDEALMPFLVARSGRARMEFVRWAAERRPVTWLERLLHSLSMTPAEIEEIKSRLPNARPAEDENSRLADQWYARVLLAAYPELRREAAGEELQREREQGRLDEARSAVRRVLARRALPLGDEQAARLSTCDDLPTLERWLDQAITAVSVDEALR